uniref:FGENESH: predicted gene_5.92 protein n=1 Tax=Rhodotorula toruloides TaxID=5286 RepID=A0A0K3CHJ5_RHOTO
MLFALLRRQRNHQLEKDLPALTAAKAAVDRARELEDVLRLKDIMVESLERQVALLEKYNAALQQKEAELVALRAEQAEQPISQPDLRHRYEQLCDIFGQLRDTLTCPVCYEPFDKDQAVSLLCGHSFCAACYAEWERKHIEAFKMSSMQGQYTGPECPECRTADVRRGRVRIWSLEEVVRLVDRATREIANKPYTPSVPPVEPLTAADLLLAADGHATSTPVGQVVEVVDDLIELEAGDEGEEKKAEEARTGDSAAMDVDPPSPSPSPSAALESLDAPSPSSPAQPAAPSTLLARPLPLFLPPQPHPPHPPPPPSNNNTSSPSPPPEPAKGPNSPASNGCREEAQEERQPRGGRLSSYRLRISSKNSGAEENVSPARI